MSILSTWNAWISQIAVAIGSATALLSLLFHAPVSVACIRGGIAWICVCLVGKACGWVLNSVDQLERKQAEEQRKAKEELEAQLEADGVTS